MTFILLAQSQWNIVLPKALWKNNISLTLSQKEKSLAPKLTDWRLSIFQNSNGCGELNLWATSFKFWKWTFLLKLMNWFYYITSFWYIINGNEFSLHLSQSYLTKIIGGSPDWEQKLPEVDPAIPFLPLLLYQAWLIQHQRNQSMKSKSVTYEYWMHIRIWQ